MMFADGMGEPGLDPSVGVLIFTAIIAGIAAIARWGFGASRWRAFSVPIVPLIIWLVYCFITGAWAVGQGGGVPLWLIVGPMTLIALPVSAITVFLLPNRKIVPKIEMASNETGPPCVNCGKRIPEGSKLCPACGWTQPIASAKD